MKTIPTVEGKMYCVSATTECTITSQSGTVLGTASPGTPFWFQAQKGETTTLSDDAAEYSASRFNSAPQQQLAIIGVLGGNDSLPAVYTRLAYLGTKQFTKIDTLLRVSPETGAQIRGRNLWNDNPNYSALSGVEAQFLVLGVNPATRVPSFAWSTQANNNSWIALTNGLVINTQESGAFPGLIPYSDFGDFRASLNFCMSGKWEYTEGELALSGELPAGGAGSLRNIYLFSRNYSAYDAMTRYSWRGIVYSAVFSEGKKIVRNFIPVLDSAGVPCMFDTVTRQTFRNSGTGQFIAGVENQTQLNNMLRRLPDRTGQDVGTLQVRLAEDLQTPENDAKLDAMLAKNWEITQAA